MRTTTTQRPEKILLLPTKQTLYALLDELTLSDYSGKKCVSFPEIKHAHLNYILEPFTSNQNN